jgi:serine/threonine-protein kinase
MPAPTQDEMPDVGGMDVKRATAAIKAAGLDPQRLDTTVAGVAPGTVVGQSPAGGTKLASGSTVYIEATTGTYSPPTAIPDVRGFGAGQAQQQLAGLGFTVRTEAVAAPAGSLGPDGQPYLPGQVWRTTPAAGQRSPDGVVVVTYQTASGAAAPPPATTPATTPTTAPRRR